MARFQSFRSRITLLISLLVASTLALWGYVTQIQPRRIAENQTTEFSLVEVSNLFSTELIKGASNQHAPSLADFDNDGDLDLVLLAMQSEGDYTLNLYQNEQANFTLAQTVSLIAGSKPKCECQATTIVDVNTDGWVDVMVTIEGVATLWLNENGLLSADPIWQSPQHARNVAIAWGDVDNDGDDDLALSDDEQVGLYKNVNGVLSADFVWESAEKSRVQRWADVNNDGWLDLISAEPAALHLNQNGSLTKNSVWTITEDNDVSDPYVHDTLLVEDFDGNGWLDFALYKAVDATVDEVSTMHNAIADEISIFHNADGLPATVASAKFRVDGSRYANFYSADIDNDNDFDLIISRESPIIFYNHDGHFDPIAAAINAHLPDALHIAFGDLDSNGSLDLITDGQNPAAYLSKQIDFSPLTDLDIDANGCQIELGDMNHDSHLELVVGDDATQLQLYQVVSETMLWESQPAPDLGTFGWVDIDNDGDLDLAATTGIYHNQNGTLGETPSTMLPSEARVIAWADINQDGWQDIFLHDNRTTLHMNEAGIINPAAAWQTHENAHDIQDGLALDDIDSDGDLDVTIAIRHPDDRDSDLLIFENDAGRLQSEPRQRLNGSAIHALDWADVDSDGDLDLAIADSGILKLFLMIDGQLTSTDWQTSVDDGTYQLEWIDIDNDGDVDLVEANRSPVRPHINLFANHNGTLSDQPQWETAFNELISDHDLGDLNRDGLLDMVIMRCQEKQPVGVYYGEGVHLPATDGGATLRIDRVGSADLNTHTSVLPITYTISHAGGQPFRAVQAFYSLNGSGDWQPAIATTDTITTDLKLDGTQATYTFNWDVDASHFFGSSDNVVVRIEALPAFKSSPRLGGITTPLGKVSGQTPPMRVSGSQVLVTQDGEPVEGAIVYRLAADSAETIATPLSNAIGKPLQTMANGLLEGRDTLRVGDQLVALHPISATQTYTLYHSSAIPTVAGLAMQPVEALGVQELTVSAENPLMLFNFDVSLEWDARSDLDFLNQLRSDIKRTSEILFDLSNGQVALGDVTIYHAQTNWQTADIVVYADNRHRPNASLGGIVDQPHNDTLKTGEEIVNAIVPGQIRIGAVWNRYGEPSGTIGEDWPRVLAHEIGHYAFFQLDNYLGRDPQTGQLDLIDCRGSVMTDSYRQDYTEFLSRSRNSIGYVWEDTCLNTLAELSTGRSDWETIRTFYPFLHEQLTTVDGPRTLPLAVTHVTIAPDDTQPMPLADEFFYLLDINGNSQFVPDASAYLIQTQGTITPTDDQVLPLGAPIGQLVQARGVKVGDLVCTYATEVAGCTTVQADDRRLTLAPRDGWQPEIDIRPATSSTLQITVTLEAPSTLSHLFVQLYPHGHLTQTLESSVVALDAVGDGVFSAEIDLPITIFSGHARVWSDANRAHESIVRFAWVPGWDGHHIIGWDGHHIIGWDGHHIVGWGTHTNNAWQAPVASPDGQVSILDLDNIYSRHGSVLLQSVDRSTLPSWLTPIGDVYRYIDDNTITHTIAIQFRYLERHMPLIDQDQLVIYFQAHDSQQWQPLPTTLDTIHNVAFARLMGNGLYALVATVEMPPFEVGWNLFSYPLNDPRSTAEALVSIAGDYTEIEQLDPFAGDPVNEGTTPTQLEFGQLYRIYITRPTTLYLTPPP